jgi:beta-xylosidase
LVLPGKGIIDPSSLWDEDGQAYLVVGWAGSRAGVNALLTVYRMNKEGTLVIDEGKHVYDGHGIDPTIEGPKLYKRNGYYYIFAPAGGVATGWQLALRSKSIYGPYERKLVMDQGSTPVNGPHQGAWVQTPTGENWFLHFQDKEAYGRVVHLQPVQWKNNWPVIGVDKDGDGKGEPVLTYKKPNVGKTYPVATPPESDEFDKDELGLQWQWQANPKIQWSALIRNTGYLRLFAYPSDTSKNLWTVPNLLLQKFPAPDFTATAKLEWNAEPNAWDKKKAGLIIMGDDYAYLSISKTDKNYVIKQVVCKGASAGRGEEIADQQNLTDSTIYVRVIVSSPDAQCIFSYSEDGINFKTIGKPFTAKPGRWIGAKVGLFCISGAGVRHGGYADIDWFRITK